jgi:hypothetical protein
LLSSTVRHPLRVQPAPAPRLKQAFPLVARGAGPQACNLGRSARVAQLVEHFTCNGGLGRGLDPRSQHLFASAQFGPNIGTDNLLPLLSTKSHSFDRAVESGLNQIDRSRPPASYKAMPQTAPKSPAIPCGSAGWVRSNGPQISTCPSTALSSRSASKRVQ